MSKIGNIGAHRFDEQPLDATLAACRRVTESRRAALARLIDEDAYGAATASAAKRLADALEQESLIERRAYRRARGLPPLLMGGDA